MLAVEMRWAMAHDACQRCGSDRRPHKARGYCNRCYAVLYYACQLPGTIRTNTYEWEQEECRKERAADAYSDEVYRRWFAHRYGHDFDLWERSWRRPKGWTPDDEADWIWWHGAAMYDIPRWPEEP